MIVKDHSVYAELDIETKRTRPYRSTVIEADDIYDWRYDDRTDWENERRRLDQWVRPLEALQ